MRKLGQLAMEFLTLIIFVFLIFIMFYKGSYEQKISIDKENEGLVARDIAYKIREEILIAEIVEDGYEREFSIPLLLNNRYEYEVNITSNILFVSTEHHSVDLSIPPINHSLNLDAKEFFISKKGGVISFVQK